MLRCIALCVLPLISAAMVLPRFEVKGTADRGGVESLVFYSDEADIWDYPFFAALNNCGAAIIYSIWVVTAAHCVYNKSHEAVWVGGETYSNSEKVTIDQITVHPAYNKDAFLDDMALIKLKKPLKFTDKVQPALLPYRTELKAVESQEHLFIGRGNDETLTADKHLRKSKMEVYSASQCYRYFHTEKYFLEHSTMTKRNINVICAVREMNLPGLCNGDSGSPLVQGNVLKGLGSYIIEGTCKSPDSYLVNVKYYVPWIESVIGDER